MTGHHQPPPREAFHGPSSFTLRAQCAKTVVAAIVVTAKSPNDLPHHPIDREATSLRTLLNALRVANRFARF